METEQCQVLNLERLQALKTWLKRTNTKLTQVNGQRKYGGPPEVWDGPVPAAHCEVFISQIPRDTYEDLLIPLFSSVGPLWEFRLMMNFSGQNRGFAYAKYGSSAKASEAVHQLNGYQLEPGCHLSVHRSTEKRTLCVGGLPSVTRQEDLLKVLRLMAEGVERVSLKSGPGIEGVLAIVTFSSHNAASMAKKVLVEAFKKQFSLSVSIKWQSGEKPNPDKPQKNQLPSPLKALSSGQSVLPPHWAFHPSTPPGFCRAVGGPAATQQLKPSCSPPSSSCQGPAEPAASPVIFLQKLCEVTGIGRPLYEIYYSHTGPDGFLFFTYKVCIPGVTSAFSGLVMILPGPDVHSMTEEAQMAAAKQVLLRINSQLTT